MKGFTLVELLVTVTLIGILAALSLSIFEEYKIKANQANARVALHNIYVASETLMDDMPQTGPAEYHVRDTAEGTFTVLVDDLVGSQKIEDFLPNYLTRSDVLFGIRLLVDKIGFCRRLYAGISLCNVPSGEINLFFKDHRWSGAGCTFSDASTEMYHAAYGVGGAEC